MFVLGYAMQDSKYIIVPKTPNYNNGTKTVATSDSGREEG